MKISVHSLGCRLNMAEMESVVTELRSRGHDITTEGESDICVINTCVVTGASEKKSRQLIRQSLRAVAPKHRGRVIVTGCAVGSLPAVDDIILVDNDHKHLIPDIIENENTIQKCNGANASRFSFTPAVMGTRTRGHLKIQDGCDRFCSYCVIPYVRGGPQCRPADEVIKEFNLLIDKGIREIVLTGVMIGHYRWQDTDLACLTARLLDTKGDFRIHLTSINPDSVTPALVKIFRHDKMVRHLHLSLQSGSDAILEKMNRRYRIRDYRRIIDEIRGMDPLFNFTTDCIVGFPGERNDDFSASLDAVRDIGFSHVHTFRYSPRPMTAASLMEDSVPEQLKIERSGRIRELSAHNRINYLKGFHDRASVIIGETCKKGLTLGHNEYYVPVAAEGRFPRNSFIRVLSTYDDRTGELTGKALSVMD